MAIAIIEEEVITGLVDKISRLERMVEQLLGQAPATAQEEFLSADQACQFLNICNTTLVKYQDEIGFSKKGRNKEFLKSDLIEWRKKRYGKL